MVFESSPEVAVIVPVCGVSVTMLVVTSKVAAPDILLVL